MSPILTYMHKLISMVTLICYSQIYGQILNFKKYNSITVLNGTINIMTILSLPFSMFLPHFFTLLHCLEFCGQCCLIA